MANTSATRNEVNDFLTQMRFCLTTLNGYVIYNTRDKNKQLMAVMDWYKEDQKRDWLLRLEVDDYFEGPDINEQPRLNSVWKFGKMSFASLSTLQNKICICL